MGAISTAVEWNAMAHIKKLQPIPNFNFQTQFVSWLQSVLHHQPQLAPFSMGIPICGQQQADHGFRTDATHHLHH